MSDYDMFSNKSHIKHSLGTSKSLSITLCACLALSFGCDDDPQVNTEAINDAEVAGQIMADAEVAGQEPGGQEPGGQEPGGQGQVTERERLETVALERSLTLPNLTAPVEVIFTEGMVPNIYAENEEDLGKALGYVLAKDRFFNMDILRRLAQGRLSELFGDVALETDIESLGLGMGLVTERLEAHTSERSKRYLSAVAEGVNTYIEAVRSGDEEPPSELSLAAPLFGAQPIDLMMPWTLTDMISMATTIMYQTNFEDKDINATDKFLRLEEIYGDDSQRRDAFILDVALNMTPPVNSNSAQPSSTWGEDNPWGLSAALPKGESANVIRAESTEINAPKKIREVEGEDTPSISNKTHDINLPTRYPLVHRVGQTRIKKLKNRLAQRHGWFGRDHNVGFGSNAWAAGQAATGSGSIVSGDGHLQLSIPSIMYQVGLNTKTLGGGEIHQKGLLIASIPVMAVGTNGKVAWSQVNPVVDITDWYVEQLQLDESGAPQASYFRDEWRPLTTREESVPVAGRVLLGSEERVVTWLNYLTFDGRWIVEMEGRELGEDELPNDGETVVNLLGTRIVPTDLDEDGLITAISFDYTAFDATGFIDALFNLGLAQDMADFERETKRLIGGGLFSAAGDHEGSILYTSYQAIPCRSYLERDEDGFFLPGQSPMALLDGTQIGGFTILSDDEGYVDESQNDDPYRCSIPYSQMPKSLNPINGYIATANNDPQGFSDDGRVDNDAWYLGGPWSPFRVSTITRSLGKEVDQGPITVDSMKRIQSNVDSRMGELFTPYLLTTITQLDEWLNEGVGIGDPSRERAVALYSDHKIRIQEATTRLKEWGERGYQAQSGVETFYNSVDDVQRLDAVATSIFNEYLRAFLPKVWQDEEEGSIPYDGTRLKIYALERMLRGRGADNPLDLASWSDVHNESLFFDRLDTPDDVERSEELMISALVAGMNRLAEVPIEYGLGGYGTEEMSEWLWGLHHLGRLESLLGPFLGTGGPFGTILERFSVNTSKVPLADNIPEGDPRAELNWFPRHGDQWNIDAGNPGFGGGYTFSNGAVMRMTIHLDGEQVRGYNIVPGGQSGLEDDPHSADQLKLWLANEAYPIRYHLDEVLEGAVSRWQFTNGTTE
jgi:penicillin G amidase